MQRDAYVCQRSNKVRYGRPIGWSRQRDAHVCQRSDEVRYVRPIGRGIQRDVIHKEKDSCDNCHRRNFSIDPRYKLRFTVVLNKDKEIHTCNHEQWMIQ